MPVSSSRFAHWLALPLIAVGIPLLVGCANDGRPETYPVTGTITWQGKPLAGATIVFVPGPDGGEGAAATSDADGKFAVSTYASGDGARPGQYRLRVMKYEGPKVDPNRKSMTYEEEVAAPDNDPSLRPAPPPKNLLPKKYESETSSGLVHTVSNGPSTLDITIE
jgi:hypothetical protein